MLKRWMLACIWFYQHYISPNTPPACRYHPTCSEYAKQAITRHGWREGGWLAALRIARCHPLHPGGDDPVP
ncbi:MAG: membrane protein insertion efficiency factor YidD [Deltaproteobacteria bacterium]|nr:membrane protein insertion efficiency factor YidD [Deltaproteobacteria bacterium]MBU51415.1 membrane protein insertion efficiency factor YidD [Deltaproteobacteria bacterium]